MMTSSTSSTSSLSSSSSSISSLSTDHEYWWPIVATAAAALIGGAALLWRRHTQESVTNDNEQVEELGLPLPLRVAQVTDEFMTQVLRKSGVLAPNSNVQISHVRTLDGGVHYEVAQIALRTVTPKNSTNYSDNSNNYVPSSVVIKLFTGSLQWYQRWLLRIDERLPPHVARFLWPVLHATALRIKSYKIESRLYKRYYNMLSIPTPRAYYCHSDLVRQRFLVVLEDLCGMDRGEPHGFSFRQSEHLVRALARFHRSSLLNVNLPKLLDASKFWHYGGYWFGPKEILYGTDIIRGAEHLIASFGDAFTPNERTLVRKTAAKLHAVSAQLTEAVHSFTPRVLLHGDYKISNLFINSADQVYAIDWQWLGGGFPASDLAYFVYTSVLYGDLVLTDTDVTPNCSCNEESIAAHASNAPEREYEMFTKSQKRGGLVTRQSAAKSAASANGANGDGVSDREFYHYYGDREWSLIETYYNELDARDRISFPLFERAYRLNVIYFTLFCMRCKYDWLTPQHMARYAGVPEDGLHLRKIEHLKLLIKRAAVFLRHSAILFE